MFAGAAISASKAKEVKRGGKLVAKQIINLYTFAAHAIMLQAGYQLMFLPFQLFQQRLVDYIETTNCAHQI